MSEKKECSYCKTARYGFCKRHVPADKPAGLGWMIARGKGQFDDSRRLITQADFLKSPEAVAYKIVKGPDGEKQKRFLWYWMPYLSPGMPQAARDTVITCAAKEQADCYMRANRGYWCAGHQPHYKRKKVAT